MDNPHLSHRLLQETDALNLDKSLQLAEPILTVEHSDQLDRIADPSTDGVIWNRCLPSSVEKAIACLKHKDADELRWRGLPTNAHNEVRRFLQDADIKDIEAVSWVAKDIEAQASIYAKIVNVERVQIRLEIVTNDACRKFHRDAVKARIICTYVGPGTEYGLLADSEEPFRVETVPTGAPILLKGKAWMGSSRDDRVYHRSPPIEHTGEARLVLVIDADLANKA